MIRRWSRLNYLTASMSFIKASKIEIFRSAVHLKKFFFKFTKFKRKTIAKWKHRGNWYPYLNLFKFWSIDYLFNKKICKYQFLFHIFSNSFLIFDSNYIKKNTLPNFTNDCNFNSIAISKKIYFYLFNFDKIFFLKNLNIHFLFVNTQILTITNNHTTLLNAYHDRNFFNQNNIKLNDIFDVSKFLSSTFALTFNQLVEIYKILTIIWYFFLLKR